MVCLAIKTSGALTGNIMQLEASPQRGQVPPESIFTPRFSMGRTSKSL